MCSSVAVYVQYAVYIQTSGSFIRDPKGSGPSRSCDVGCAVGITSVMCDLNLAVTHISGILT